MAQPTSTGWRIGIHGGHGKGEAEGGAVAETALDGDLAAEGLDQAAHQGEAQARALVGVGLKRSKMVLRRSASMPRPESRTVNWTKFFISSAASRISPSGGV